MSHQKPQVKGEAGPSNGSFPNDSNDSHGIKYPLEQTDNPIASTSHSIPWPSVTYGIPDQGTNGVHMGVSTRLPIVSDWSSDEDDEEDDGEIERTETESPGETVQHKLAKMLAVTSDPSLGDIQIFSEFCSFSGKMKADAYQFSCQRRTGYSAVSGEQDTQHQQEWQYRYSSLNEIRSNYEKSSVLDRPRRTSEQQTQSPWSCWEPLVVDDDM
jgi:hypothetical protein